MSHIVLTFYDNIVFRWIYIYCFIYILKRMSFSILTFSSLSYTFGHVYAFFEEFDNLVYFVLGPKKKLFIASPATEPIQLPRPKIFNCCFRNKINKCNFICSGTKKRKNTYSLRKKWYWSRRLPTANKTARQC